MTFALHTKILAHTHAYVCTHIHKCTRMHTEVLAADVLRLCAWAGDRARG